MPALVPTPMPTRRRVIVVGKRIALGAIWVYRAGISPYLPGQCIYQPTCSVYTADAIATHGVLRGVWLGARRLLRCHPFTDGGFDPVPEKRN